MTTRFLTLVALVCGSFFLTNSQATAQTSLSIRNNSLSDMYHIYISDANSSEWGKDLLGRYDVLESGESVRYTFTRSGNYDIKIVDEDGDTCILWDVFIRGSKVWNITTDSHLDCID